MQMPLGDEDEKARDNAAAIIPVGKTQYGIYFGEILENIPVSQVLASYCEDRKILLPWSEVKSVFIVKGSLNTQASALNSIDMISANLDAAYLPNPSDCYVSKNALIVSLLALGIKSKGVTINAIRQRYQINIIY